MATAQATHACEQMRLDRSVTIDDLKTSRDTYNYLLSDDQQPNIEPYLERVGKVFLQWNTHKILGVHLIHGHQTMSQDHAMFGTRLDQGVPGWWTRPVHINKIMTMPIHGHIFALSSDRQLQPYEYREGSPPQSITQLQDGFFQDFINILDACQLHGVLGLQVLDQSPTSEMFEYVVDGQGTVMVAEKDINHPKVCKYTGWTFDRDENGYVSFKGNEAHGDPGNGTHAIFRDSKPLISVTAVMRMLVEERIIEGIH